jgi:hypothetical protein
MAIRRCPYCKAIIDESQKYCNNCGTQLLFPEDELVEEDIKGEKLVDEDFKDSEEEFEESLEPSGEDEPQKEEIDLEKVLEGGAAFPGEDEVEAEQVDIDEEFKKEIAEKEPFGKPVKEPIPARVPPPPVFEPPPVAAPVPALKRAAPAPAPPPIKPAPTVSEPAKPAPIQADLSKPAVPKTAPVKLVPPKPAPPKPEPAVEEEPVAEKPKRRLRQPPAPKTPVIEEREVQAIAADEPPDEAEADAPLDEELESDEENADKSDPDTREEIVRLIAALEKKQKKLSLTRDEEKLLAPLEEASSLQPWSDLSKSGASTDIVEEEAEEKTAEKAESRNFVPGDTMDFEEEVMTRAEKMAPTRSTIGIPERVTKDKSGFLFDKEEMAKVKTDELGIPRYEIEQAEEDVSEAEEEHAEPEERPVEVPRTRLGFFGRLTALVFDLIFIALVWMGTVWGAALMMDAPVRSLVRAVPLPLGGLFLILLAGYFFLFFFFLGETLGGRMAAPRD